MKQVKLETFDFAQDPTQASLAEVLKETVRIRVWDEGISGDEPIGEMLLEITDPQEIEKLCAVLRIDDGPAGHCLCYGDIAFELLSRDHRQLALLGLHHGVLLRWNTWIEDAALDDGLAVLEWLAGLGVTEPLERYLDDQEEEEETVEAWNRWIDAMPACLQALPEDDWRSVIEENRRDIVLNALAAHYPDTHAAILALLHWYGSNSGSWTGYPIYEDLAAAILSWYPVQGLIAAMEGAVLTPAQLEGAARLCSGNNFQEAVTGFKPACLLQFPGTQYLVPSVQLAFITPRSGGPAQIPAGLRRQLLDYCLQSSDEDKRSRARSAFRP
jgi:hypothetical protein